MKNLSSSHHTISLCASIFIMVLSYPADALAENCKNCAVQITKFPHSTSWTDGVCNQLRRIDKNVECKEASIIGIDNRKKARDSKDPLIQELANQVPLVSFCGGSSTAILIKRTTENSDYIMITAHQLYDGKGNYKEYDSMDDGHLDKTCNLEEFQKALYGFNLKYVGTDKDTFGKTLEQGITVWPPINLEAAKNYSSTGEEVLIFKLTEKISEQIIPDTKRPRGYAKFVPLGEYDVSRFSGNATNLSFHNDSNTDLMEESKYEIVKLRETDPSIDYRAKNDSFPGSSNSPHFVKNNGQFGIFALTIEAAGKERISEGTPSFNWTGLMNTEKLVKKYNLVTTGTPD